MLSMMVKIIGEAMLYITHYYQWNTSYIIQNKLNENNLFVSEMQSLKVLIYILLPYIKAHICEFFAILNFEISKTRLYIRPWVPKFVPKKSEAETKNKWKVKIRIELTCQSFQGEIFHGDFWPSSICDKFVIRFRNALQCLRKGHIKYSFMNLATERL